MRFARHECFIGICLLAMLPGRAVADAVFWGCAYEGPQPLRSGHITCRQEVLERRGG